SVPVGLKSLIRVPPYRAKIVTFARLNAQNPGWHHTLWRLPVQWEGGQNSQIYHQSVLARAGNGVIEGRDPNEDTLRMLRFYSSMNSGIGKELDGRKYARKNEDFTVSPTPHTDSIG
ncbi:MAG: hypothetical protein M1835_000981, partial [Candelina submexicana]